MNTLDRYREVIGEFLGPVEILQWLASYHPSNGCKLNYFHVSTSNLRCKDIYVCLMSTTDPITSEDDPMYGYNYNLSEMVLRGLGCWVEGFFNLDGALLSGSDGGQFALVDVERKSISHILYLIEPDQTIREESR